MIAIETGFDLVFDSQKAFRVLLEVFSRPGEVATLQSINYQSLPEGMNGHLFTVLKTLLDSSVEFSISTSIENSEVWAEYIRVNTGGIISPVHNSHFALFNGNVFTTEFDKLCLGSLEFPEQGATAIISVDSLSKNSRNNGDITLVLSGPGIKASNSLFVDPFDLSYITAFEKHTSNYPMGIELLFIDNCGAVAGINRTSSVKV